MQRYGECFLNGRIQNNDKRILSSNISTSLNYIKRLPIKPCSDEFPKLLESFKKAELKNKGFQTQNRKVPKLIISIISDNKVREFLTFQEVLEKHGTEIQS